MNTYENVKHKCKSCGETWTVRMRLVGDFLLPVYTGLDTSLCPKCVSGNTIMFTDKQEVEP